MKNVLSMLILLTLAGGMFAQETDQKMKFGIGVLAGAGIDVASVKDKEALSGTGYEYKLVPNFGWSAGIKVDADFMKYIGAEFNVLVSSIGYTQNVSTTSTDDVKSRTSGVSLEVNLMARPQYPLNVGSIYGLLGLGVQFEVGSASVKVGDSTPEKGPNTPKYAALNLPVGLGYQMPAGPGKLSFDARYNVPLTVFSKTTDETESLYSDVTTEEIALVKLSALRVVIAYTYQF